MAIIEAADVRDYLRASAAVTDDELTQVAAAADAVVTPMLAASVVADAEESGGDGWPEPVVEFALFVAAGMWKARESSGSVVELDGIQFTPNSAINSGLMRRAYVLIGPYLDVAGWVG